MNAHALRPRAGQWTPRSTSGLGGLRCSLCEKDAQHGWGFVDAGQITTTTAFVCAACADVLHTSTEQEQT